LTIEIANSPVLELPHKVARHISPEEGGLQSFQGDIKIPIRAINLLEMSSEFWGIMIDDTTQKSIGKGKLTSPEGCATKSPVSKHTK
jgi:hypothetical protein